MKYLPILTCLVLLIACNKNGDDAKKNLATFQFKYNDTLRTFTEGTLVPDDSSYVSAIIYKEPVSQRAPIFYRFQGYCDFRTSLFIPVYTDSLMPTTYHIVYSPTQYEDQPGFGTNYMAFGLSKPGDSFTVTINSYQNGLVSGTFSGSLSLVYNQGTGIAPDHADITEGKFENVSVYYNR